MCQHSPAAAAGPKRMARSSLPDNLRIDSRRLYYKVQQTKETTSTLNPSLAGQKQHNVKNFLDLFGIYGLRPYLQPCDRLPALEV